MVHAYKMSYWKLIFYLTAITVAYSYIPDADVVEDPPVLSPDYMSHKTISKPDKVDLQVYYESLCPYSIDLFKTLLNETVTKLASYLDLRTYPFGNAKLQEINGKKKYKCQHGPEECYGNTLHACAIDILKNSTRSYFYNTCLMAAHWGGEGSSDNDATNCGKEMNIDGNLIIDCAKSEKGKELLEHYRMETEKVSSKQGVPWILINGKLYDGDGKDFISTICSALVHPPLQCH